MLQKASLTEEGLYRIKGQGETENAEDKWEGNKKELKGNNDY